MGVFSKLTDIVGGSLFKEVKDLATAYFPPDVSPEKRAEFELKWQELTDRKIVETNNNALATLQAELADVQDARKNNSLSIMPAVIFGVLTGIEVGLLVSAVYLNITEDQRNLAVQLFREITPFWAASIVYWIGTTRSSGVKTDIISKSQPIK